MINDPARATVVARVKESLARACLWEGRKEWEAVLAPVAHFLPTDGAQPDIEYLFGWTPEKAPRETFLKRLVQQASASLGNREDRVVWALRWLRLYLLRVLGERDEGAKAAYDGFLFKYAQDAAKAQGLDGTHEAAYDAVLKAFMDDYTWPKFMVTMAELLREEVPTYRDVEFGYRVPPDVIEDLEKARSEYREQVKRIIPADKHHPNETVLKEYKSGPLAGYRWVGLGVSKSPYEARAMNHCGNDSRYHKPQDRLYSLRKPVKVYGVVGERPAVTVVVRNGVAREIRGYANSRPKAKYADAITDFLLFDFVTGFRVPSHQPYGNFQPDDIPASRKSAVLAHFRRFKAPRAKPPTGFGHAAVQRQAFDDPDAFLETLNRMFAEAGVRVRWRWHEPGHVLEAVEPQHYERDPGGASRAVYGPYTAVEAYALFHRQRTGGADGMDVLNAFEQRFGSERPVKLLKGYLDALRSGAGVDDLAGFLVEPDADAFAAATTVAAVSALSLRVHATPGFLLRQLYGNSNRFSKRAVKALVSNFRRWALERFDAQPSEAWDSEVAAMLAKLGGDTGDGRRYFNDQDRAEVARIARTGHRPNLVLSRVNAFLERNDAPFRLAPLGMPSDFAFPLVFVDAQGAPQTQTVDVTVLLNDDAFHPVWQQIVKKDTPEIRVALAKMALKVFNEAALGSGALLPFTYLLKDRKGLIVPTPDNRTHTLAVPPAAFAEAEVVLATTWRAAMDALGVFDGKHVPLLVKTDGLLDYGVAMADKRFKEYWPAFVQGLRLAAGLDESLARRLRSLTHDIMRDKIQV